MRDLLEITGMIFIVILLACLFWLALVITP